MDQPVNGEPAPGQVRIGPDFHDVGASPQNHVQVIGHFTAKTDIEPKQSGQLALGIPDPVAAMIVVLSREWIVTTQ